MRQGSLVPEHSQLIPLLSLAGFCSAAEAHNPGALVIVLLSTLFIQLIGLGLQVTLIKLNRRAGVWAAVELIVVCLSWLAWLTTAPMLFLGSIFSSNFHGSDMLVTLTLAVTQTFAIYTLRKLTKAGEPEPLVKARGPLLMTGGSLGFFILAVGVGLTRHA